MTVCLQKQTKKIPHVTQIHLQLNNLGGQSFYDASNDLKKTQIANTTDFLFSSSKVFYE